mgnify:FL=1
MSHGKGKRRKYIQPLKFLGVDSSLIKIKFHFFPLLGTGYGDVAFNPRRNILGAMCVKGKIAYQLYNFGTSKSDGIVKLIRKTKWHSQYSTKKGNNQFISYVRLVLIFLYLDNHITSLDFSPNGETVATIDYYGTCLISDVNTDSYRFHLNMEMKRDYGK